MYLGVGSSQPSSLEVPFTKGLQQVAGSLQQPCDRAVKQSRALRRGAGRRRLHSTRLRLPRSAAAVSALHFAAQAASLVGVPGPWPSAPGERRTASCCWQQCAGVHEPEQAVVQQVGTTAPQHSAGSQHSAANLVPEHRVSFVTFSRPPLRQVVDQCANPPHSWPAGTAAKKQA